MQNQKEQYLLSTKVDLNLAHKLFSALRTAQLAILYRQLSAVLTLSSLLTVLAPKHKYCNRRGVLDLPAALDRSCAWL
ncbi:hypothetical protein BKA66DRAFT_565169 [Pyrenochaeta sp. MPI-SDFR-AT-0127]|nr:hypothetical protein BKA66DRAFT_565169 [Pyrenochaeta sp. MPI-SDFR-AT-0127]